MSGFWRLLGASVAPAVPAALLVVGLLGSCGGDDRAASDKATVPPGAGGAAPQGGAGPQPSSAPPKRAEPSSAKPAERRAPAVVPAGVVTSIERLPDPREIGDSATGRANGDFAPELSHRDLLSGRPYRLSDHLGPTASESGRARAAIVGFTASWCGPCRASYPHLKALKEQHGDALEIVMVSTDVDAEGKAKEVQQMRTAGLSVPLLDADDDSLRAWMGRRRNVPHFYILNTIGEVLVQDRGFGKKVKKVLPGQVRYALNHPEYVVRTKRKARPKPAAAPSRSPDGT